MKKPTIRANDRAFKVSARGMRFGFIALLLLVGAGVSSLAFSQSKVPSTSRTDPMPVTRTPMMTVSYSTPPIVTLGQQYMDALLHQKYAVMWSMLHPQAQARWSDQGSFTNYLQARFANYTLQGFSSGKVIPLASWTNPETMIEYDNVEMMPISLQLVSRLTSQQQTQLAPQFQGSTQLLQNVPFIVQQVASHQKGSPGQWLILKGGPTDPEAPIIPPFNPISKTVAVPILMYHYISGVPANDPNPVLRQSLSVSPQLFNQQLDYLKAQGFHSVTFNQVMNALYYGVPLPSKPIAFTFDDGYLDSYTDAYPALKAHGFSGMFYIITGKVGWQGQMNWDQLREMLANGMQMGSHTVHHADMGTTYRSSVDLANQELQVSQKNMQDQLGMSIQHFCYPYGSPFMGSNVALQHAVVALVAANGYIDATTDPGPTGVMQNSQAPFALLRLRIDGRSSLQSFINTMKNYA